jgi:hypothetical protein
MSTLQPVRRRRMPKAPIPTGPLAGLSDPRFRYVPSVATDIRKTFRRIAAQRANGGPL